MAQSVWGMGYRGWLWNRHMACRSTPQPEGLVSNDRSREVIGTEAGPVSVGIEMTISLVTVRRNANMCAASKLTGDLWFCEQGLDDVQCGLESLAKLLVLGANSLIVLLRRLEVEVRFLRRQVPNLMFQRFNVSFVALADCALSLTVIGSFLGQLIGGEISNASGRCAIQLTLPPSGCRKS